MAPVSDRIIFKASVTTFKCLNGQPQKYMRDLLTLQILTKYIRLHDINKPNIQSFAAQRMECS